MTTVATGTQMIQQAYRFALDPTPRQARMLSSHAGARRYVYNWANARISAAADARRAEKDAGLEPVTVIPGQFEIGPEFTVFKNTATGCRRCRALLIRGHDGTWITARDGEPSCAEDGQDRQPHEPTIVTCARCCEILADDGTGTWRDRRGSAACPEATCRRECPEAECVHVTHDLSSEFLAWTDEIFSGTMQAAMRDADMAWKRHLSRKARRPRFKKKGKSADSFQVHGDGLRMPDTIKVIVNEPYRADATRSGRGRPRRRGQKHSGATVRQAAHHITLPKIGTVAVMSDNSLHPAMTRSRARTAAGTAMAQARLDATRRKLAAARAAYAETANAAEIPGGTFGRETRQSAAQRERLEAAIARLHDAVRAAEKTLTTAAATPDIAGGNRHMGNRRRADILHRHLRNSAAKAAELGPLLRQIREDAGLTIAQAVAELGAVADARAVSAAEELLAAAERSLRKTADDEERKKARSRLAYAETKLKKLAQQEPGEKAPRTERWSNAKLAAAEKTGSVDLDQADVLCAAYRLPWDGQHRRKVMDLAAQASITRATISRGADGLWWCSVGAEIPAEIRTTPSRAQREGGIIGLDFGVREIATASNGVRIPNPRHYEAALAELRDAQRKLSRSAPGSERRAADQRAVGLIHADVARLRADAIHRATTVLARQHSVIAVEGWNVQQVMQDGSKDLPGDVRRGRNRALADAAVGKTREFLAYKTPRMGAEFMATDPHARSGNTCYVHKTARTTPLKPYHEMFTSDKCQCVRPRRENTAKAVAGWARQELSKRGSPSGGPGKPRGGGQALAVRRAPASSPAKRAASTRRGRGETGIPGG